MLLLLLNPFQEDAVVDIAFDADVGIDRLTAVVVPARRLAVIDVTQEVTVASRVSARIEALAGRVVGSRIQTRTGTARGLTVTPLVQDGAAASSHTVRAPQVFAALQSFRTSSPRWTQPSGPQAALSRAAS